MFLEIKLIKSIHHQRPNIRRSMEGLGLRHIGQITKKQDNAVIRGMIQKVIHLVSVQKKSQ